MKTKIAFVVSTPLTINSFMLEHIKALSKTYDVYVIANKKFGLVSDCINVSFIHLPMQREISLYNDVSCIFKLIKIIHAYRFDVIHSITPKAALVAMVSSFACRVEHRFHTFTGQVWATKTGFLKNLLKLIDKLIFKLSTHVLVDSPSQKQFLLDNNVISDSGSTVLANGSISGVDISKFCFSNSDFTAVRKKFDIPESAFVHLFLGRLCKDKGIDELLDAFAHNTAAGSDAFLLFVGPNEQEYDNVFFEKYNCYNIKVAGLTNNPNQFFSAADALVLPSYREGFGTVVLEAAANGIPTVGSDIYGLSDAIVHNETGLLHKVHDVKELANCMLRLERNKEFCKKIGEQAKRRVYDDFTSELLTNELVEFYKTRLND